MQTSFSFFFFFFFFLMIRRPPRSTRVRSSAASDVYKRQGMYKWAVYFLKDWNCKCDHVWGFNMDEWSDSEGNTLPSDDPGAFQNAMEKSFYGPLGELTIPKNQRNFATKDNLPQYPEKIQKIR